MIYKKKIQYKLLTFVSVCVCVCVCIYIYLFIYTHTHTHTHIQAHMYTKANIEAICDIYIIATCIYDFIYVNIRSLHVDIAVIGNDLQWKVFISAFAWKQWHPSHITEVCGMSVNCLLKPSDSMLGFMSSHCASCGAPLFVFLRIIIL